MIGRAIEAGVPFSWFTADEAYGQAKYLQAWLEDQDVFYAMAIRRSDTLTTTSGEQRADALIAAAPAPGLAAAVHRAWGARPARVPLGPDLGPDHHVAARARAQAAGPPPPVRPR